MSLKLIIAGSLFSLISSAATINTFYDLSQFTQAAEQQSPRSSFVTETFAGNQINTPGLSIESCNYPPGLPPPGINPCGSPGQGPGIGLFVNNRWDDAVGRFPYNPANNKFGHYVETTFSIPGNPYAVGFLADIPAPEINSALNITILGTQSADNVTLYPFGGGPPPTPGSSHAYQGFVGFVSNDPITGILFGPTFTGAEYRFTDLTWDPAGAAILTPEPAALPVFGSGLLGLLWLRKKFARSAHYGSANAT